MSKAAPHSMQVALNAANVLGEGVVWCDRAQALYWTDIQRCQLFRWHPSSDRREQWTLPERLASFALCAQEGWLLLALASRLAFFRLSDGTLRSLHEVEPGQPTRCNDGACDRQGRFVFGTLHEPISGPKRTEGGFWRLNTDLSLEPLPLPSVAISNSIAFSPRGDVMYYCDSLARRIDCCDYGDTLHGFRTFVELNDAAGEPDGSCVDATGALWNAQWGLARVVRYAPNGTVLQTLHVPAYQPTRPALGGPRLDTLYVTSARDGLSADELAADPLAGALFHSTVSTPGLPEPRFGGAPV
ncbi:SMP-30/gluconolactonase/LRE family protein [Dyella sp. ASV21]|uniref:SMP-30/gluconolactonase/LRE family protein n=1 Tax=Dyella sp. ASV21 TaxID=2795114 RepID=UPI0018EE3393|nr:SMP-30/gluconolactonase/LRE family protein [Dyella sp. ASV21]